jgi:hypothetical protein
MLFIRLFVGFHLMRRGVPYGIPSLGDRASGVHGRPVHRVPTVHLFVMVLIAVIFGWFVMTIHGTFGLLLRLGQAHAAIGGFTDPR